jgi:signal transduction histidine kinase/ligand-binding sensor domain-containing protein/CheY-like chemotaxis protein/AraC-like DNA-binding protein
MFRFAGIWVWAAGLCACSGYSNTGIALEGGNEQKVSAQASFLTIKSFCQDSLGYMWIATMHGLNRYNGYEFIQYFHEESDSLSLDDDMISSLYLDSFHRLWIGTYSGINRYDFKTNRFIRYPVEAFHEKLPVFAFFEDHHGRLWAGTEAGPVWIDTTRCLTHFLPHPHATYSFCEDALHNLWMGGKTGITMYHNGTWDNTPLPGGKQLSAEIYSAPDGKWWLGTNEGIVLFDPASATFAPPPAACRNHPALRKTRINFIKEIDRLKLLIGTEYHGLFLYDMLLQTLQPAPWLQHDDQSKQFLSCYIDRQENVWVGTYDKSFSVWNRSQAYFNEDYRLSNLVKDKFVTRIVEDAHGNLWLGTRYDGLFCYCASGKTMVYTAGNSPLFAGDESFIETLFIDSHNRLWIGTAKQLIVASISAGGHIQPIGRADIPDVRTIKEDAEGNIWLGASWMGMFRLDHRHAPFTGMQRIYKDTNIPDICILSSGDLLFSKYNNGLFRLVAGDSVPKPLEIPHSDAATAVAKNCITLFCDSKHRIWAGSYGHGLFCLSQDHCLVLSKNNGLPSNNILCFQEDRQGNIWISTSSGISRLNPADTTVTNFFVSDGTLGNQYHEKGGMTHTDGRIFFTGNHGLTFFNPLNALPVKSPPVIHLTGLKILNSKVAPAPNEQTLPTNIAYVNDITLKHQQSNFSIDYTGIDFLTPDRLTYAYKMEGFDKEWNYVNNFRRATYSNLPAGKYVFLVKSINSDGMESLKPASIRMTIRPAPWFSPIAWAAYVLAFAAIVFSLFRLTVKIKMNKQLFKLEHNERLREQEVFEMKINFFTNISHELRTPLTLISAPLEQLLTRNIQQEPNLRLLNTISRNVQSMLRLINQLLDFRKIENGGLLLQVQQEDLVAFIRNIADVFIYPTSKKQIALTFLPHATAAMLWMDTDKLEKILHNLLSNALKHTPEKGTITISTALLSDTEAGKKYAGKGGLKGYPYVEITVSDTGCGVPEDKLGDLFVRYRQINGPSGRKPDYGGSGIGLHYTKRLIETHNGFIHAENNPTGGMSFSVVLPVEDCYSEKEKQQQTAALITDDYAAEAPSPLLPAVQSSPEKPYTILVAEDNAELMDFIRELLCSQYALLEAPDGNKAWEMAQHEQPDLILSDVLMPGLSGYQLCAQVKQHPNLSHIPVVLLTAKSAVFDQIEGLEQGADAYICKPFHVDYLLLTIKNLFMARDKLRLYYSTPQTGEKAPFPVKLSAYDRKFMDKLTELLEQRISDPNLNVSSIGRELGFSSTGFFRKIKGLTDMSPLDFLRNFRLKTAAELLQDSVVPLNEIPEKIGFSSYSYFAKSFKNHFGFTPKEYRQK